MNVEWFSLGASGDWADNAPPTGVSVLVTLAIPGSDARTVSERWYSHARGWQCMDKGDLTVEWLILAWCYKPHPWAGKETLE